MRPAPFATYRSIQTWELGGKQDEDKELLNTLSYFYFVEGAAN